MNEGDLGPRRVLPLLGPNVPLRIPLTPALLTTYDLEGGDVGSWRTNTPSSADLLGGVVASCRSDVALRSLLPSCLLLAFLLCAFVCLFVCFKKEGNTPRARAGVSQREPLAVCTQRGYRRGRAPTADLLLGRARRSRLVFRSKTEFAVG